MAESAKTAPKAAAPPAPPPVAPEPEPIAPPRPPSKAELAWRKFSKTLASLMTLTFFLVLGLGLIVLGFVEQATRFSHHLPKYLEPFLALTRITYSLVGLGLFCLALARGYAFREYAAEIKKNKKSPHRWKIPFIGTQILLFYLG